MTLIDTRSLPAEVLERLAGIDPARLGIQTVQRGRILEARPWRRLDFRDAADGDGGPVVVDGYATVYDYPYDVAGGPAAYGWTETFAAGACTKSVLERDDVRLLFDHEGIPLARTASGTLALASDEVGLSCSAELDPCSPYVQSVASAMRRRDADQMSLAFRVIRQEWNGDYTERIIREVQLFDVSVVTYPANPATVAQLRAALDAAGDSADPGDPELDAEPAARSISAAAVAAAADVARLRARRHELPL